MTGEPIGLVPIPGSTPALDAAVGTMPAGFRLTSRTDAPHVAWVMGGPGWAEDAAAALAAGALAVAVDTCGPFTPAEIDRFAAEPVFLVGTRTHAPQLRSLAAALPEVGEPALVDVLVVDGDAMPPEPAAVLWDAVAMLTAAGLPLSTVPRVAIGEQALVADARIGTARLHLSCVHRPGAAARAVVKVLASGGSVQASMGDPLVAAPGEVLVVGSGDARLAATRYLTPRRVALEEIRDVIAGQARPSGLLARYADAAHLLGQVVWPHHKQSAPTQLEGRST